MACTLRYCSRPNFIRIQNFADVNSVMEGASTHKLNLFKKSINLLFPIMQVICKEVNDPSSWIH